MEATNLDAYVACRYLFEVCRVQLRCVVFVEEVIICRGIDVVEACVSRRKVQ